MRGNVDGNALVFNAVSGQPVFQRVQGMLRARGDRQIRRIHSPQIKVITQIRAQLRGRQVDRQHAPCWHRIEQFATQMDKADAVLERHDTSHTGGGVFAHGMTRQRGRVYAPTFPQLGQRNLDDQDQGQLNRWCQQLFIRGLFATVFRQPDSAGVFVGQRVQLGQTAIHPFGENRLCFVQIPRHTRVLRPATREHEGDVRIGQRGVAVHTARIVLFQQIGGLGMAGRHNDTAAIKGAAALFQRKGNVSERLVRLRPQVRRQTLGVFIQSGLIPARDRQDLEREHAVLRRGTRGGLLQHRMRIGPAYAQRIHTSPTRVIRFAPFGQRVIHAEGRGFEIDRGVRCLVPQGRRHLFVVQRQGRLDQTGRSGSRVQMADVGFHRPDPAEARLIGGLAKRLCQCRDLNRVAQIGAGAVAFNVIDGVRRCIGYCQRLGNRGGLSVDRRRQIARFGCAIVVDRRAANDRPDVIAVGNRIIQSAQHHHTSARAKDSALRAVIKGVALPVRRQDFVFFVQIATVLRQLDRDTARNRHIAFAIQQRLRCIMRGNQRRGTRRLDVDRRAFQIQHMAKARCQEILVVPCVPQQEHACVFHQIGVRTQVEVQIAAHTAARKDADLTGEVFGHVTGVLQRLPRGFQKTAVLGIKDRGLFRRKPKEFRIETVEPVQGSCKRNIVAMTQTAFVFPCLKQFLFGQLPDRGHAIAQIAPVGCNRLGPWQMRGHTNNGNIAAASTLRLIFKRHTHNVLRHSRRNLCGKFGRNAATRGYIVHIPYNIG